MGVGSITISMRAFPIRRLEVISPVVAARQKQNRKPSAIDAARGNKPTIRVRSIE
jgi:hypothetical protein